MHLRFFKTLLLIRCLEVWLAFRGSVPRKHLSRFLMKNVAASWQKVFCTHMKF